MRTIILKVIGTLLVLVPLMYPLWAPEWGRGILGEVESQGMPGALIAVAIFFGLVALYCRALQRTLTLLPSTARTAAPASVWWMFAIPYNFTEDFFIVRSIAASLTADPVIPTPVVRRWATVGYGWCAAQILSLFPGAAGYLGGAVALVLWAAHWIMTVRFNRRLADRRPAAPLAAHHP
ncbi:hypothetical protein [Streptomyces albipurpureus]|uniref:DUF4328 domain-containing protein n=1 Tax=Streptomyces albipurpureus TaxID=2897419 RepID=A0ABT0V0Q5_9ACTN|nr:hypothetical protein [Streptomyces sp. CWNU-1]MCM2394289.1 hypothetical protein [Streptomyces sp. CWNU-1]